jgi:uncharacterized protein
MNPGGAIVIFGASARAAAFSALRAGLRPWCADLFADRDLQARCPVRRIAAKQYAGDLAIIDREGPAGPCMYTGGVENRSALVKLISRRRPLWGCAAEAVRKARSPRFLANLLHQSDLPCPQLWKVQSKPPPRGQWLVKSRFGSGGIGVRFLDSNRFEHKQQRVYIQEFIEGEACSAVYVGDGHGAQLLGATRQLVGEPWLHAAPFHYCGNIGPLPLSATAAQTLRRLGDVLAKGCGLRGLFGVDFILRDHVPWPVEVNPRYTASIEVLEHAVGVPAMALHKSVFAESRTEPVPAPTAGPSMVVGKAILFARTSLSFPASGPWETALAQSLDVREMSAFADIPAPGEPIAARHPILTFFARAGDMAACLAQLQQIAQELDRSLFPE